jgi:hypothetical protein
VGRLQSLAGCLISWRYDMISKRASKLKSSIRKETAKARNLEVYSSRGKGHAKAWERETCRLRPRPSRHRTWLSFLSPQAGANLRLLKPAYRHFSLHAKTEKPR